MFLRLQKTLCSQTLRYWYFFTHLFVVFSSFLFPSTNPPISLFLFLLQSFPRIFITICILCMLWPILSISLFLFFFIHQFCYFLDVFLCLSFSFPYNYSYLTYFIINFIILSHFSLSLHFIYLSFYFPYLFSSLFSPTLFITHVWHILLIFLSRPLIYSPIILLSIFISSPFSSFLHNYSYLTYFVIYFIIISFYLLITYNFTFHLYSLLFLLLFFNYTYLTYSTIFTNLSHNYPFYYFLDLSLLLLFYFPYH